MQICGERDDGNSPFDDKAVSLLNKAYQGLLAGGNLFGIDIAEPWSWAEAKRPIVLKLLPYEAATVSLVQDAVSGTFAVAPTISLEGRYLSLDGYADKYKITQHTANQTAFHIDAPFILDSGDYAASCYKLEYKAIDDTIVIDSTNNKIDFAAEGSDYTATLTAGSYSPTSLCTEIDTRMTAASGSSYTASFDSTTRKFSIVQGGTTFSLKFVSGTNATKSASDVLGFECLDYTGALTYTSAYALSAILRITKPMSIYRESPLYGQAAKEAGKIFYIDANTLEREFPILRINESVPSKFTIAEQTPDGIWTLRFNDSVSGEAIRAELHFIPVTRDLQNNSVSVPKVPSPYTDFLIYAACYHLLMEKSDSKAPQYFQMAQAQLKALVNDSKKAISLGGNNFGRIIPRSNRSKYYGYKV